MFTVEKTGTKTSSLINAIKAMEKNSGINLASDYYTDGETVFLFDGMGYGHGAGISQWGCKYMADIGKTYREILEYYYEGTQITNIN
jgi:SpoIID/LytB domain protein